MPRQMKTIACGAAVLVAAIGFRVTVTAQRGGGGGGGRQIVPVAASSLAAHPETYLGDHVSLMAAVEQMLSRTAFSVDQDKNASTGQDVLVLAPTLQKPVEVNQYVTVVGDVMRFEPEAVAARVKDYTLDLPADVIERFRGRVVVIATSVIDATMEDVAKVPPPPLTPEEEAFDGTMKRVNAASGALRAALDDSRTDQVREQTAVLETAFGEAETFFKGRGTADATGWAQEARGFVQKIEQAATAGVWDDARSASTSLTQMCATCHAAYRVRLDDGTFRVKFDR